MGRDSALCCSAGVDARIRRWRLPDLDMDPYDGYGGSRCWGGTRDGDGDDTGHIRTPSSPASHRGVPSPAAVSPVPPPRPLRCACVRPRPPPPQPRATRGDLAPRSPDPGVLSGVLDGHGDAVWGLAFNPAGDRLASCSADGTVRIWDPRREDGACLSTYDAQSGEPGGGTSPRPRGRPCHPPVTLPVPPTP